jgi:chromosome segregation ATPase
MNHPEEMMAGEQQKQEKKYKSPTNKLVKFFEKSRDAWKKKCRDAKRTVKSLKNRIRLLEHSKEHWKNRAEELEAEIERLHSQKASLEERVDTLKKNRAACRGCCSS